jgi:uncharacterized protein (TIGR03067 family)
MYRQLLTVACIVAFSWANSAKGDSSKDDLEKLKGDWTVVSVERNGTKQTAKDFKEFTRKVTGATVTVTVETEEGVHTVVSKIKLDPSSSPRNIDVEMTEGDFKGKTLLGIYKFEDDKQVMCIAPPGKDRPTKFDSNDGTVTIWKRVKTPAK